MILCKKILWKRIICTVLDDFIVEIVSINMTLDSMWKLYPTNMTLLQKSYNTWTTLISEIIHDIYYFSVNILY